VGVEPQASVLEDRLRDLPADMGPVLMRPRFFPGEEPARRILAEKGPALVDIEADEVGGGGWKRELAGFPVLGLALDEDEDHAILSAVA
jgi:hypothetical protein